MTTPIIIDTSGLTNSYNEYKSTLLSEIDNNCNDKDDYIKTFKDDSTGWNVEKSTEIDDKVEQILEQSKPNNIIIYNSIDESVVVKNGSQEEQQQNTEIIQKTIESLQNSIPDDSNKNVNEDCFIKCKQDILSKDTGCDFKCNLTSDYIDNNIVSECNSDTIINNQNCFVNNDNLVCIYDSPANKCKLNNSQLSSVFSKQCVEDDKIDKQSCVKINDTYYCSQTNVTPSNNKQCNEQPVSTSPKSSNKCYMK